MSGRSEILHRAIQLIEAGHSPESALEAMRAAGEIDAAAQGTLIEDLRFAFDLRRAARPRAPGALRERLALALLEAPEPGDLPADDLSDAAPATDAVGEGARDATRGARFRIPGRFLRRPALRLGFAAIALVLALSSSVVILAAAPTLPTPWQGLQRISRALVDRFDTADRSPAISSRGSDARVQPAYGGALDAAPTAVRRVNGGADLEGSGSADADRAQRDGDRDASAAGVDVGDARERLVAVSTSGAVTTPTIDARTSTATPTPPPTAPRPPSREPNLDPDPDDPPEEPSATAVATAVVMTAVPTTTPTLQATRVVSATPSPSSSPEPTSLRACGGLSGGLLDPFGQGFTGEARLQLLQRPASSTMGGTLVAERTVDGGRYAVQLVGEECDGLPANGEVYPVLLALPSAGTAGGEVIGWHGSWQGGPEAVAPNNSSAGTDLTLFVDAIPANAEPCRRGGGSTEGLVRLSGGSPAASARVRFELTTVAGTGPLHFVTTAADGSFQAGGLCAGGYQLSAQLPLAPGPAFGQLRQPVTIDPNSPVTGLEIRLDGGLWNLLNSGWTMH